MLCQYKRLWTFKSSNFATRVGKACSWCMPWPLNPKLSPNYKIAYFAAARSFEPLVLLWPEYSNASIAFQLLEVYSYLLRTAEVLLDKAYRAVSTRQSCASRSLSTRAPAVQFLLMNRQSCSSRAMSTHRAVSLQPWGLYSTELCRFSSLKHSEQNFELLLHLGKRETLSVIITTSTFH